MGSTQSLLTYRATAGTADDFELDGLLVDQCCRACTIQTSQCCVPGRRASLVVAKASKTDDAAEQLQAKATELLEVAQVA